MSQHCDQVRGETCRWTKSLVNKEIYASKMHDLTYSGPPHEELRAEGMVREILSLESL